MKRIYLLWLQPYCGGSITFLKTNISFSPHFFKNKLLFRKSALPPSCNVDRWILQFRGSPVQSLSHPCLPRGYPAGSENTRRQDMSIKWSCIIWCSYYSGVTLEKKCSSALFITLHKHSDGVFSKIIHSIIITCHRVNTYSYQWSYHNFCM